MFRGPKTFRAGGKQNALLVLSDGYVWTGQGIGVCGKRPGEICFNVSMTGYQEIMTDPSYAGQIVTFTFPHIGNVGCNPEDDESKKVFAQGLILREPISSPSNFRSTKNFETWLVERGVVGLCGVDTRALAQNIRERGARDGVICHLEEGETVCLDELIREAMNCPTLLGRELASAVTTSESYTWEEGLSDAVRSKGKRESKEYHVVALDFGIKRTILRYLADSGTRVTVLPCYSSFERIMSHAPDGIFLSNGPGDPFATFERVRGTIAKIMKANIPLFGICLGNQLLSLACGLGTLKLGQGHRGANHPVKNLATGKVEITGQNHGFCVSKENVPPSVEITHVSLFDGTVEGIRHLEKNLFAVQYHPESSPGPHDSSYLFREFYKMMEEGPRA
ncbi:MAG: glutamine-hydrolyzing carbamoyl-phosphate synthase small subunit [Bacteriovoracales bacterium]|nr:glutamine-hydrolyzing carbamoyl-phosphate synthase small subunit [Bacteriovoracales bacterium]